MRAAFLFRKLVAFLLVLLLLGGLSSVSADSPWQPPVNLSNSGSAAQPAVAVSSDGVAHIVWWDVFAGTLYAGMTATGSVVAQPSAVMHIVGERRVDTRTGRTIAQTAPREPTLVAAGDTLHVLWQTTDNTLMTTQKTELAWGQVITLATSVPARDVFSDGRNVIHLAYVRVADAEAAPTGVYYRSNTDRRWSDALPVYLSPYFRTMKTEAMHLSIAGQGTRVMVVWDDPVLDQSVYAYSSDGGATWSRPHLIVGRQNMRVQRARVATTPDGGFLLIWQDAAGGGCGLTQSLSADGGVSWGAPERMLPGMARCPVRWQFSLASDRLWLVGLPAVDKENTAQVGTVAAWDGKQWSNAVDIGLSFRNPLTQRTVSLGSLAIGVGGTTMTVVGCDDKGDVWATVNAVPLEQLVPTLTPVWSGPQMLSDGKGPVGMPVAVGDGDGRLYVMWSQGPGVGETTMGLYVSVWDGARWGRASKVFATVANPVGIIAGMQLRAEQPALAMDGRGRLYAVWSGGTSGRIMYSWVYARDASSADAWAEPLAIPAPTDVGSGPDIVADPRGDVRHVVYAVPYNEKRGIYYVRNSERGTGIREQGSGNGGQWTTPTVVLDAVVAGWESVSKPRLALDAASNTLHLAWLRSSIPSESERWASLPSGEIASHRALAVTIQSLYYSRSTDGGQTWSPAQKVIEGTVDWPRLVVAGGQVHLVWNRLRSNGSADLWHQFSTDGGVQWSQPSMVRGFDRLSGPVAVAADGAGAVHLVGMGQGQQGVAALLRGLWDGSTWSRSEMLALNQATMTGNGVGATILSEGGQLAVVARQWMLGADGRGQFQVVATARQVQAVPVTPAPTFTPLPSPTPSVTPTPRATPMPAPDIPRDAPPPPTAADQIAGQLPLVLGGGLAIVMVLGAFVTRGLWGRR